MKIIFSQVFNVSPTIDSQCKFESFVDKNEFESIGSSCTIGFLKGHDLAGEVFFPEHIQANIVEISDIKILEFESGFAPVYRYSSIPINHEMKYICYRKFIDQAQPYLNESSFLMREPRMDLLIGETIGWF